MPLREDALRTTTRDALPNTRSGPRVDVRTRFAASAFAVTTYRVDNSRACIEKGALFCAEGMKWWQAKRVSAEAAAGKAASVLAKPAFGWLKGRFRPDTRPPALMQVADELAFKVELREKGLLDQLRAGPNMVMDLKFQVGSRLKWVEKSDETGLLSIGAYFRQQASPRRLVVLGEAGAGKTVLAVHLLLDLLRDRKDASTATLQFAIPVPVRVNIAGWDGGGDFTSWLTGRLGTDYRLQEKQAEKLLEAGRILPILDGLDELDPLDAEPERARKALEHLNEPPWGDQSVVVMCRTSVYARIRELNNEAGLHGATTITLQAFSPTRICNYLDDYRKKREIPSDAWKPVTDAIRNNPEGPLATALETPWLLSLAATTMRRDSRTGKQLAACTDTTEISDLLFADLIRAAIKGIDRGRRSPNFTDEKVQTWMRTLAQHLEHRRAERIGSNEIRLDQVWEIAGIRRCRALHGLWYGLVAGLAVGLAMGLSVGPKSALAAWLVVALAVGLVTERPEKDDSAVVDGFAWRVPGHPRWGRGLRSGASAGLQLSFWVTLMSTLGSFVLEHIRGWPTPPLGSVAEIALAIGLGCGLLFGLALGFWTGLSTEPHERLVLGQDARRIIHDDLVAGVAVGLLTGLGGGVPIGLLAGFSRLTPSWLISGLGPAFLIALVLAWILAFGVIFGLLGAYGAGRYATASIIFAATGRFPRRPTQFLEWARDAGLLRVTGVAYQFRHATYREWLAAGRDNQDAAVRPDIADVASN
jgi:hypothetical protein